MTRTSARRTVAALGIAAAVTGTTLVATPSADAAGRITVTFRNGALTVAGNDSANDIRLVTNSRGRIVVRANSRIVHRGGTPTVRNVRTIKVSTYGGNDTVYLPRNGPGGLVQLGSGDDYGFGSDKADVFRGGAGNDRLNGHGGDDVLLGDAGNDGIQGHGGSNRIQGNAGHDELSGVATDIVRGGTGNDVYRLWGGTAVEAPGEGVDTIWVGTSAGAVTFSLASSAPQSLPGGRSVRLSAGDTFENLHGGVGADVLIGNGLANRISGGKGDDQITGAGGADAFAAGDNFGEWSEINEGEVPINFAHDTLTDFDETDTIDLTPSGEVTGGLGTDTVTIDAQWDFGSMTATGHTFDAEDFS